MQNHMPTQFSEEENDIIMAKDRIYKKVSDLFALLKQGEDEAQVCMLNWENYVIQQEKMQKLREEISTLLLQSKIKLTSYHDRIGNLRSAVRFFTQTCKIVSSAFLQVGSAGGVIKPHPMSPGSKGDGTTCTSDRDH